MRRPKTEDRRHNRGQTAMEYMLIITVAIVMIAALWYFMKGSKSETTYERTKDVYDYFIDLEGGSGLGTGPGGPGPTTCTPGSTQNCPLQQGVCAGAQETCTPGGIWPGCAAANYLLRDRYFETAETSCDGKDNDCDGTVDDSICPTVTYYCDSDGDTYISISVSGTCNTFNCRPAGCQTTVGNDCDDTPVSGASIHPGAAEICNAKDDNCNGAIDETGCPSCTAKTYGGHTYQFCNAMKSWSAANSNCTSTGYGLVEIESAAENSWIYTQATGISNTEWLLGANDLTTEGTWIWPSGIQFWNGISAPAGTPVGGRYANWYSIEPNNDGNEDCGEINHGVGSPTPYLSKWNDIPCTNSYRFICETGGPSTCTPSFTPLDGGDHCGLDWSISGIDVAGVHTNVGAFTVTGTVTVRDYSGGNYGYFEVHATTVNIVGTLDAIAAGNGGGGGGGGAGGANQGGPAGAPGDGGDGVSGGSDGVGGGRGGGGGGGDGGRGGGSYPGNGGSGGVGGVGSGTGGTGNSGNPGRYCAGVTSSCTGTSMNIWLGSGGGGGGGGGGGNYRSVPMPNGGGGGGGAGGRGGGGVYLHASTSLRIPGTVIATGTKAGNGANGQNGISRAVFGTSSAGGDGGAGGNASSSGSSSAGGGGRGDRGGASGGSGGVGGAGSGGGLLLDCPDIVVSGTIDLRDGNGDATYGGFLKIFGDSTPSLGGTINVGKTYTA